MKLFLLAAGIAGLRGFGAVFGTGRLAAFHAAGIECAANDVLTHTGKVTDSSAFDQNHRVFLQIVTLAADVSGDFDTVRQADPGDLPHSGVRLFRGSGCDLHANAASLRALHECLGLAFRNFRAAARFHQLINGRHVLLHLFIFCS